jgi:hypothetical protein
MSAFVQAGPQADLFALLGPAPAPPKTPYDWDPPEPDWGLLEAMEGQGRHPLGGEDWDRTPEAIRGVAHETMYGLVWFLAEIASMDEIVRSGRGNFRSAKAWQAFLDAYPKQRATHVRDYEGMLGAVSEVWGRSGSEAFDVEARRLVQNPVDLENPVRS